MDPKKGKKFKLEIIPATKQKGHKTVVLHNYRKKKKRIALCSEGDQEDILRTSGEDMDKIMYP